MDSLILSLPAECQSLKIDLRKLPKKEAVRLSDLGATDIQYIPLETTKQNVLPEIKKIVFGKSFFLTHSYANINMFRYNGQFVTKISKEGRGPDEITVAHDIDINPKDETIYLVDGWLQKFLVYNRDGKLMRSFKSPLKIAINFRITNDGILCYNDNNMAKTTDSFILIDTLGKVIMNYPNTYKWQDKTNRTVGYLHENLFYRFNDQIFKKEMYSDTVFVYRDKAFKPHIIIDVGKLRITPEARTNSPVAYIIHNFLTPHKLFECGDYIYYEFSYQPDDENEGFSVIASKGNNFKIFFDPEKGLINDLDGGPNIIPQTVKDNNILVTWIDAIDFKNHISSETFRKSKPLYPEKKKELEKLAASLKETDNPVLVQVRLKH
ncbi:MAG: 6-bladed beta-propeller [Bacteroidales bacterium]|jgi:hypothetical protein